MKKKSARRLPNFWCPACDCAFRTASQYWAHKCPVKAVKDVRNAETK